MDVVGIDEAVNAAGSFPNLTLDTTTKPFLFYDLALTIGATQQYWCQEFELSIANAIDRNRFFNSPVLTALNPTDRQIRFRTKVPYGAASALYGAGSSGVALSAVFTYGGQILSITAGTLVFPRKKLTVPGRQEILVPIEGFLMKSGGTYELTTTLKTS